ncbi:MAG: hypothetical protein H8D84_02110 [Proteobacteria bacterium]|nr:hypothetical protein [Pseudomonadota bacterium]
MSAIINNSFRKYQADNFISSFITNNIYVAIGKNDAWNGASLGEYSQTSPSDTAVPTPDDTSVSPGIHWNDLLALKKIPSSSVSHVIARYDWESGTVYREYSHTRNDIIDNNNSATSTLEKPFYVFTEDFRVYKCISNGNGAQSTIKPTGSGTGIIPTSDGYRWKYMFEVLQADVLKYVTTDWLPVKSPANNNTTQKTVEDAAVDGALEYIKVTAGGTGYKTNAGTARAGGGANTIPLADSGSTPASAVDNFYDNMIVRITSGTGVGQFRTITNYTGATRTATISPDWDANLVPDQTSVYTVFPAVTITSSDSSSPASAAVSKITDGVIEEVIVYVAGTGYRSGTAVVTNGGGANATLEVVISPPGGHGKNAVSELGGAFVMMNVRLIGFEGEDIPINDDFRKVHIMANPKLNTSGNPLATGTVYQKSEVQEDSGIFLYTEFRTPIYRASDSTEDIKLVVEF